MSSSTGGSGIGAGIFLMRPSPIFCANLPENVPSRALGRNMWQADRRKRKRGSITYDFGSLYLIPVHV